LHGNHDDRCWLEPEQKRRLREVDGRIGLRKQDIAEPMSQADIGGPMSQADVP
jgi:hypothetical protein